MEPITHTRSAGLALAFVAALAAGCAASPAPENAAADGTAAETLPLEDVGTMARDFDAGQEVHLTAKGPVPKILAAAVDQDVRFINDTDGPIRIVAVDGTFESGPVAPGDAYAYTPTGLRSLAYEVRGARKRYRGAVQIEHTDPRGFQDPPGQGTGTETAGE